MTKSIIKDIVGSSCIVLGTILSSNVGDRILSPIVFSVGILLVISFDLGLITRSIPSGRPFKLCLVTFIVNLLTATILGFLLKSTGDYPLTLVTDVWSAVATGIIIGLVSAVNKYKNDYTVMITMILMFSFVYLKLPHCVVYAFYLGCHMSLNNALSLLVVCFGNLIGGLIVRGLLMFIANDTQLH